MMHKDTRMMLGSIARLKKKRLQHKTQSPRYVMAHYPTDQIRTDAATQRYSDNQIIQLICYWLKYFRPYCTVILVRHHEIYSKRNGEAQFRYHRKRRYDKISYCYSMDCGQGEAYNEWM